MSTEQNKAVVRRFYEEVMNKGEIAALDEVVEPDFEDHGETLFGSPRGRHSLKEGIQLIRQLLPDIHVTIEDMTASGDMVGVRGTMRCIHTGEFVGVSPTGNELTWKGIAMFRVVDGKIKQRWFNSDSLGILNQLGLWSPAQ